MDIQKKNCYDLAYSLESKSEHPLAKAIVAIRGRKTDRAAVRLLNLRHFPEMAWNGKVGDADVKGGSLKFAQSQTKISEKIRNQAEELAEEGKTPLMFTEKWYTCRYDRSC